MTQIDFYILEEPQFKDSLAFACRLAEKAYQQGHQITIECADDVANLDMWLWTFNDESFLPHGPDHHHSNRIVVSRLHQQGAPLFLKLTLSPIDAAESWQRVLQIVPKDPSLRNSARQLYRHYQSQGHTLNTHTIK